MGYAQNKDYIGNNDTSYNLCKKITIIQKSWEKVAYKRKKNKSYDKKIDPPMNDIEKIRKLHRLVSYRKWIDIPNTIHKTHNKDYTINNENFCPYWKSLFKLGQ